MRILTVMGTRPEVIKLTPVIEALEEHYPEIESLICVTGQHNEMLHQMLRGAGLVPDFDLNVMEHDQSLSGIAGNVLIHLDAILADLRPDWVVTQGDTTTVMATAIAAHHRHIRAAHVEAGLRSHDRANPFPEEMNRVVADHVCDLLFAPTMLAHRNLISEGIPSQRIFVTGNTSIDAVLAAAKRPVPPGIIRLEVQPGRHLILVTAHRRENHGPALQHICTALSLLARRGDVQVVYPVHLNPNVRSQVFELLGDEPNVTLLDPLDHEALVHLMRRSKVILTDSGGIQEEAPTFGVPVLVLRKVTERPEAAEIGATKVVGTDVDRIVKEATRLLDDRNYYQSMSASHNPYGDGKAGKRIASLLANNGSPPEGFKPWNVAEQLAPIVR